MFFVCNMFRGLIVYSKLSLYALVSFVTLVLDVHNVKKIK
jgi:hypothetical protein